MLIRLSLELLEKKSTFKFSSSGGGKLFTATRRPTLSLTSFFLEETESDCSGYGPNIDFSKEEKKKDSLVRTWRLVCLECLKSQIFNQSI